MKTGRARRDLSLILLLVLPGLMSAGCNTTTVENHQL